LKIHPARIASKARYIVNMLKTAKAPAAQWASALLRGAEEWQVAQNTCPKQGVGGCGLHCISNCCELLLFGMVASQAKRASDDHLRLEIVQSLEKAIMTDKTITETELTRLDSCETDAININMNNSFETEFNTNITTEDTTNTSRHMTIDNSGSIILNISATYLRVMRYSSSYEYPKAANTLRRMHCVVWPDYCLTLNINPTDLVEITETWGGIYKACSASSRSATMGLSPDIEVSVQSRQNMFDDTCKQWSSALRGATAFHDHYTFATKPRLVIVGTGFDMVTTNNE
jgi:hypothetical protein